MNYTHAIRSRGFTILELMIVLIVIGVLVALAYPSYVDYIRKARRGEAQQLLMNWSVNQEIWRSNNAEYATTAQLPAPTHDNYTFSLPARSPTAFTLKAVASGDQAADHAKDGTACSTLNLNSAGQKYSGDNTAVLVCWN
jgi:type IV pilus assembly protein PilE